MLQCCVYRTARLYDMMTFRSTEYYLLTVLAGGHIIAHDNRLQACIISLCK